MKQIGLIFPFLIFLLTAQVSWGQRPDSTSRPVDSTRSRSVVSDRLNEVDEYERAPSLSKLIKKANEAFAKKNFFAAMKYYGFVLKAEPLHVESLMGYGEAAFAITSLDSAESAFQRLVDHGLSPSPDYFPKMRLAEVKFRKGNYEAAAELYDAVATLPQTPAVPADLKRKAAARRELCLWARGEGLDNPYLIKGDTTYLLDTANVNTKELYSEYVATVRGDQLYFSAYRFDFKKDRSNPKRNTVKILQAESANADLGPNHAMTVSETLFNDLKRQHTAHLTFNLEGTTAYYALGDYVGDSSDIRFDLYRRKMLPDSSWGLPEKMNVLNKVGFTTTEPSLGILPGETTETLFFVSNRPGCEGGKDIWSSQILGDSLTVPKPVSEINTDGDDVTPFYHSASNTLFFSTDSLQSLGGFDVYKSKPLKNGRWSKPEHMGAPINGPANDVFFVIDRDSKRGFFSSNRIGSTNYSEEGCCYDIYAVDFVTRYRAIALHDLRRTPLAFTNISLYEVDRKGQLTKIANPPADVSSSYAFDVKLDRKYALIGEKTGFLPDTLYFKTPDELWTKEIVDTLYLRPLINLVASVYDSTNTYEPIYGATLTFYDLGSVNKAGKFVPNYLPAQVVDLPENLNKKSYKLEFGHMYRVLAEKERFFAKNSRADSSLVISTIDLLDGGTIEAKLYLHHESPLEKYLPITLYFDNDYPKRIRTTDLQLVNAKDPFLKEMREALLIDPKDARYYDTTLLDYQKTFVEYIRKKDEYKTGFTSVLTGKEKQNELDSMDFFFEQEVRMNWDSFFALSDQIDLMLQDGDTIILTLKGYASPLSNPDYNFHLTNRRIASVYNHFMIFDGGIFTRYREKGGNNQLRFIREANGDATAPPNMNKDPKNRRLSIYDYHVSRERRVQIIGAKVSKGSNIKKDL
jgi:hypothetical protein